MLCMEPWGAAGQALACDSRGTAASCLTLTMSQCLSGSQAQARPRSNQGSSIPGVLPAPLRRRLPLL